ncbi:MAG: signal peptidase I [Bavariicoccus seileri]|uniref:Signal peptidase I n=1 Tax=Bavariicoccus seileri TaxID=549685 RepID=A0A3D4S4C9_9ENTE|nr:signal peptidase I [Bavariicoccus seileri]HCS93679.1 signal peptidase I [Bavariicoccus seileri]
MKYPKSDVPEKKDDSGIVKNLPSRNMSHKVKVSKKGKKTKEKDKVPQKHGFIREVLSWIGTIVVAFVIFFFLQTYVFAQYRVSGDSMYPTLKNGERVFANKLESINRFDVVVFDAPDANEEYVKRVIGIPGDEITHLDGKLFVNDQLVPEEFINSEPTDESQNFDGNGDFSMIAVTGELTVPEGKLFVLGDNRSNSNDSRNFGFIDEKNAHGVVRLVVWPLNEFGLLTDYHKELDLEENEK